MIYTVFAFLLLLGIAMVAWFFMNIRNESHTTTYTLRRLNLGISIGYQQSIVSSHFSNFIKDTNRPNYLFIAYFEKLLTMLSGILDQCSNPYSSDNNTVDKYMDPLMRAVNGMVKYIIVEKQDNSKFDEVLKAGQSLINQVKTFIEGDNLYHTPNNLLASLWMLRLSASIVLASSLLSQMLVKKVNKSVVNYDDIRVSPEHEQMLVEIHTLINQISQKNSLSELKATSLQLQQTGVDYLPKVITVTVNGVNWRLEALLYHRAISFDKVRNNFIIISIIHSFGWKTEPQLKTVIELIDFIKKIDSSPRYWLPGYLQENYSEDEY
ncbi:hypothetical protein H4219_005652 [Mycoemilia scoparia]|uniref:Uncharacterized protein n=1 Tax=Mycoemilia scoparia TaxID=417184 RepID=A0A9W7ZST4_9FUNG|nr:hypothetical protein H4219_005652 [Mycoemilia scoparia]